MRVITYYDKIHKQKIKLEVTDEVALFLQSSKKSWERKQKEYNYHTISLDTIVYYGESENVTLEETIVAPSEDEVMNCKTCQETMKFYNLIWKIVGKLDKEKYDLIWDLFVLKKTQRQLAFQKGITESALSQLRDTAINDLIYYFNCDEEFKQTDFYKKYIEKEMKDFFKIAKEFTLKDIGKYVLTDTYSLSKTISQTLKKLTILNEDLIDKDKISKINRVVKQTVEQLNPENDQNKILNIPENIFKDMDVKKVAENILKLLK